LGLSEVPPIKKLVVLKRAALTNGCLLSAAKSVPLGSHYSTWDAFLLYSTSLSLLTVRLILPTNQPTLPIYATTGSSSAVYVGIDGLLKQQLYYRFISVRYSP
jgi:hypothetical protein